MAILVTGAAGFIGSHLCERLLRDGEEVVGLDSFDDFYRPALKERNLCSALDHREFRLVRADVCDAARLGDVPDDVGQVVHLAARAAARASFARPALYAHVNVTGTATLLEWARARGIRTIVNASSSSVYGDLRHVPFSESDTPGAPLSPYGATKRAAELLCESCAGAEDIGIASLRYFTVYGPRQRPDLAIHKFARALRAGERIPLFGDGTSSRDYTFVDDIVDGTVSALRWSTDNAGTHRAFNLGNETSVSLAEMVETLAGAMGVRAEVEHAPAHPGDLPHTRADVARARAELGYRPSTDFRTGLERFVDWFSNEPE